MLKSTSRGAAPAVAESGFSLVEVLVAAGVLAGAVATLLHVFIFATRAQADAHSVTVAAMLATQKMEELRALPLSPEPLDVVDYADARGRMLADGAGAARFYERRWTTHPSSMARGAVVVTVTVMRPGAPGIGSVRLITLRSRPGTALTAEAE